MRRLLLAALTSAGSLLMELPALAQLSNTTSTFSGQVAATCEFLDLRENIVMSVQPRGALRYQHDFFVKANYFFPRLSIEQIEVLEEPPPEGQTIQTAVYVGDSGVIQLTATKASGDSNEKLHLRSSTYDICKT